MAQVTLFVSALLVNPLGSPVLFQTDKAGHGGVRVFVIRPEIVLSLAFAWRFYALSSARLSRTRLMDSSSVPLFDISRLSAAFGMLLTIPGVSSALDVLQASLRSGVQYSASYSTLERF